MFVCGIREKDRQEGHGFCEECMEKKRGAKEVVSTCKEKFDDSSRVKDWEGRGVEYLWGTKKKRRV